MLATLLFFSLPFLFDSKTFANESGRRKFYEDTGKRCDDYAKAGYCTKDPDTYFLCPNTCSLAHQPSNSFSSGVEQNPDQMNPYFFEFKDIADRKVNLKEYIGYVTVVAAVPIYPGMGQYWYDALEHLDTIYNHKVRLLFIPLEGQDGLRLEVKSSSPLAVLENRLNKNHPLLVYLNKILEQKIFGPDKANLFVIDKEGVHMQILVNPTFTMLSKTINDHFKNMNSEL